MSTLPGCWPGRPGAGLVAEDVFDEAAELLGGGVDARGGRGGLGGRGEELFVGGRAATDASVDVTVEVSDWSMSVRQQGRVASRLTPVLVQLFDAEPDAVNMRFHSYPPTAFAVGAVLLSRRVPRVARWTKRALG